MSKLVAMQKRVWAFELRTARKLRNHRREQGGVIGRIKRIL